MMTIEEAETMARKLYKLEQKRQETVELFKPAMERVKVELYDMAEQQKAALAPIEEEMSYLKSQLEAFSRQQLEETGAKTIRLPHATLTARKSPQGFNKDEEALLKWAEQNAAELVKVSRSVSWSDLKKELVVDDDKAIFKPTGEVLEAVTPKPEEIKYSVEVVG